MQLFLQLSKLQGTTSYFDENVGRVGVKSDTVSIRKETNCFNQNVTMGSSFYNFWHFATYQFLGYFFKRSKIPNKSIQTKLIFHIILYKERRTKIEVCNNCPLDRRKWRKWRKVLHFECVWLCNDKNEATYFSVTSVLNTRVNRK